MNNACRIRYVLALVTALFTLILEGCAIPQFTDLPFKVAPDEFYQTIKVIALEPMGLPELKHAEHVKEEFESLVLGKLKEAGFTVVPSMKYEELLNSLSKQYGGLYDPMTGKKNEAKVKDVRKKIFDELRAQHQVDAIARVRLIRGTANFDGCSVQWHGVSQAMDNCTKFGFRGHYTGRISVISLLVAIEGQEEKTLFMNAGGVQPTATLQEAGLFRSPQFEKVANDALFGNKGRNQAAVEVALGPLIQKRQ